MSPASVFIESLDGYSALIALYQRLLGRRVAIKAHSGWVSQAFAERFVKWTGCTRLDYLGRSGGVYASHLDDHKHAVDDCFRIQVRTHPGYGDLSRAFAGAGPAVLDATLKASLFNRDHLTFGISSVPLIDMFREEFGQRPQTGRTVIYPCTATGAALLDAHYRNDAQVSVTVHHCVWRTIQAVTGSACRQVASQIVKRATRLFRRPAPGAVPVEPTSSLAGRTILYFPHGRLKYGRFFTKTYLFQPGRDGTTLNDRIAVVWAPPCRDTLSLRYLRRLNIPWATDRGIRNGRAALSLYIKVLARSISAGPTQMLLALELAKFQLRTQSAKEWFQHFPEARIAYAHFDTLFPQHFVLAMKLLGIQTVALQDRLFQYAFLPNIYFDLHLVAGAGVARKMQRYGYKPKAFHYIGLPRSRLVGPPRPTSADWLSSKVRNRRLVVFMGIFPIGDEHVRLTGEAGTSDASNREFLETALDFAAGDPGAFYYLRFKETHFIRDGFEPALIARINAADNLFLDPTLDQITSYELIGAADVVIGKLSMIVEEARAAGKPAFYYDPEGYISAIDLPACERDLIAPTREVLFDMIQAPDKHFDGAKESAFMDEYYSAKSGGGTAAIRDIIASLDRGDEPAKPRLEAM